MTDRPQTMKAVVRRRYGYPDVLETVDLDRPTPDDDQVLIRVHAASLNRADWYQLTGRPPFTRPMTGWPRPKNIRIGTDYSGTVEAVGRNVTGFAPGDEVFGGRDGALAEYLVARYDRAIVAKPAGVTHDAAASMAVAATTALQALRDHGGVQPGQRVLINGASGGVGTFATQIAKALGADVTAVCGPRGVDAARAGGADRVVDYTKEDFTRLGDTFDLVVDVSGTRPWRHLRRVLEPRGTVVIVGGPKGGLLGPLGHVFGTVFATRFSRRRGTFFIAKLNKADMETLREMLDDGRIRPVVDRTFALGEVADAFEHLGDGHPQGKVIVRM